MIATGRLVPAARRRLLVWGTIFLLLATGPARALSPPDPSGGVGGDPLSGSLSVRVVAAGTTDPIPGAWVMAGPAEDVPFAGNVALADATGQSTFTSPALAGTITVTAGAAGRAYVTAFDVAVSEVVLPLPPVAPAATARIGDQFLGIEVNNGIGCLGDGNLDFGLVLPAIPIEEALTGEALAIAASEEPLSTPQGPVPVPSNLYFPRQCELFQYFEKTSYHLRLPTGHRSIYGLSARAPLTAFLSAQTLVDLIQAMSFREMDVLRDVEITGDNDAVDLNADLALTANLTLSVFNGQPGTVVLAGAGGRVTAAGGAEEVILTGVDAFDPDTDGPSSTMVLTTRPATGDLSDLVHAALVTQLRDVGTVGNGRGSTTALIRSGFVPPATRTFDSFFDIVEIESSDDRTFVWTDVTSGTSPAVAHLNTARLVLQREVPDPDDPSRSVTESRTYWILHTRGGSTSLTLPDLPSSAPTQVPDPSATAENDRLDFSQVIQFLGDDPDGFDYDWFSFRDAGAYGTQVSTNDRVLRCATRYEVQDLFLSKGASPGEVVLTWSPSPDFCHDTESGIGYEVRASATPTPSGPPGSWPLDPPFDPITLQDTDGSLANATFTHVAPEGFVCYLVTDRGLDGEEGPSGHYGDVEIVIVP